LFMGLLRTEIRGKLILLVEIIPGISML